MLTDFKKLWAMLTPVERRKSVWMTFLVILMAGAETLGVLSIMPFLSVLGRPAVVQENAYLQSAFRYFNFADTRSFIMALGLASIVLVVGSSAFKTITLHLINRFVHLLRHSISCRLLSRYLHQPYEFFLSHNPSVLATNALSEVDQLMFQLIQPLSQLLAQGFVVLAMVVLVLWYDPLTAVGIVAVLALLYGGIYGLVRRRLHRIGHERAEANSRRFQACNEALGGIKDVKVTHSAEAYETRFTHASRIFSRHMATGETLAQSPLYLVEATGYTMLIVLALILLSRSNDIAHVLPALGLYGFAAYRMLPAVQIMYRGFSKLKFSSAALEAIHKDLILPQEQHPSGSDLLQPEKEIRLDNVRYAYTSTPDKPVLEKLSLVIPAHTSLGIVGKTGAGKSTLMDLLLGLLQPQQGSLKVDGTTIQSDNVHNWQRAIGYVPQHIYLGDTTVAENIAFGVDENRIDMKAVQRAARAAQIHDFITNELQEGYHTTIGDRGIRLSGGQRQRIGIARALYRNPPVLLFDEATSALDEQTEQALTDALRKLSGDKTIIVIAHKKASLDGCHQVIEIGSQHKRGTTAAETEALHGSHEAPTDTASDPHV